MAEEERAKKESENVDWRAFGDRGRYWLRMVIDGIESSPLGQSSIITFHRSLASSHSIDL